MSQKTFIYIGIFVGSSFGGWLGSIAGHGWLSAWSLLGNTIGAFIGLWAGYKLGQNL